MTTILGDPLWAELLSIANVIFSLVLSIFSIRRWLRDRRGFGGTMMLVLGLIGLYWAGLYVFVFLTPVGVYDPVWFGQIFVRPAFTFTLATMSSIAVYRLRSGR